MINLFIVLFNDAPPYLYVYLTMHNLLPHKMCFCFKVVCINHKTAAVGNIDTTVSPAGDVMLMMPVFYNETCIGGRQMFYQSL